MSVENAPLAAPSPISVFVIRPTKGWVPIRFREIWERRELLYLLTARDITVRYKQTVLGAAWAIIQPMMTMIVFTVIMGGLAKIGSYDLPYPVFNFPAMLPWAFFASGLEKASNSLVGNSAMLKKVYFPRLIVPISGVMAGFVDFLLAFLVQIGLMITYSFQGFDFTPTLYLLYIPGLLLIAFTTALGVGLWLSAMNVQFRDVRYAVPFLVQMWFLLTPVIWGSAKLQEPWRTLCALNPMAGVVEGFRYALLASELGGKVAPPGIMIPISALVSVALLVSGAYYFARMERIFADVV